MSNLIDGLADSGRRSKSTTRLRKNLFELREKEVPVGAQCNWCGSRSEYDAKFGLCRTCIQNYVDHKGRLCYICGEPSSRPLREGVCQPCIGKRLQIPQNLMEMLKARYVGMIRGH